MITQTSRNAAAEKRKTTALEKKKLNASAKKDNSPVAPVIKDAVNREMNKIRGSDLDGCIA